MTPEEIRARGYANSTNNAPLPPRCPYCATDMPEISCYNWNMQVAMGLGVILAIYCPNGDCRKLIGTQILLVPHQSEESALVRPS
jgi:hypothetical protein